MHGQQESGEQDRQCMANWKVENKTDNAWPTGKWRTRQTIVDKTIHTKH